MRRKGVLMKKLVGRAIISLRHVLVVCEIENPLAAFSIMALLEDKRKKS